jgi:hypothetical protein
VLALRCWFSFALDAKAENEDMAVKILRYRRRYGGIEIAFNELESFQINAMLVEYPIDCSIHTSPPLFYLHIVRMTSMF